MPTAFLCNVGPPPVVLGCIKFLQLMDDYDEELCTIWNMDDEDEKKHTLIQEYYNRKDKEREVRKNDEKLAELLAKESWHENGLNTPRCTRGK